MAFGVFYYGDFEMCLAGSAVFALKWMLGTSPKQLGKNSQQLSVSRAGADGTAIRSIFFSALRVTALAQSVSTKPALRTREGEKAGFRHLQCLGRLASDSTELRSIKQFGIGVAISIGVARYRRPCKGVASPGRQLVSANMNR